jgi:uncharacterized protein YbaR (Trm112 family)
MHVELIDRLRCTAAHEDSWLVAAATETVDRNIIAGVLGCPVCGAEYPVTDGDVWYSSSQANAAADDADLTARTDADDATRLAALIGVDERGGLYALQGAEGRFAGALGLIESVKLILIDPPRGVAAPATIRGAGERIPLATGSLRGIALENAAEVLLEAAARALAPRGRLVAPADAAVPAGITVLARDTRQWVGEAGARSSPPVTLRRSTN